MEWRNVAIGTGYPHPWTGKNCTVGFDCPIDRATGRDWRSHMAIELSDDPNIPNYERADFMIEVASFGKQRHSTAPHIFTNV